MLQPLSKKVFNTAHYTASIMCLIPTLLLNVIRAGQCIPIIGAGFSLNGTLDEGAMPTWCQLTKKIAELGQIQGEDPLQIFQQFQDNSGRTALTNAVEELLHKDKVKPDHVHRHFVKLDYFDTICTTNYDNLLEDACKQEGVLVNIIVEKEQVAKYGSKQNLKILKMHGDLDHPQELVITDKDYSSYHEKKKALELFLFSLLMTRTPLYIGFSLEDPNFLKIKEKVDSTMGEAGRKGYVVLFDPSTRQIESYREMNLQVIPIQTNGKTEADCLLELFKQIDQQHGTEELTSVQISANRTMLFRNQTLEIGIQTKGNLTQPALVYIKNDGGEILYHTDTNNMVEFHKGCFEKQLVLNERKWKEGKRYTIYAELNGQKVNESFIISDPVDIIAQLDSPFYAYGGEITLTTIVPQASIGSNINFKIYNRAQNIIQEGLIPVKIERTGIFQTLIKTEGEAWKVGEEFKIVTKYRDKSAHAYVSAPNFEAIVELDQKTYSWADKVHITVIDPDFALGLHKGSTIESNKNKLVSVQTSLGTISQYRLIKAGTDTGVFTGEIALSGFLNKEIKNKSQRKYPFGITKGNGPCDGLLACTNKDTILVRFQYSNEKVAIGSAIIRWNVGEVQWSEPSYRINDYAQIRVIDPDMSVSSDEIDVFDIQIWSDSDTKGIQIPVYETGTNTGIFEGLVCFSKGGSSEMGLLNVSEGDDVTAGYTDTTLPEPNGPNDKLIISATTQILSQNEKLLPPLERFTVKQVLVTNLVGQVLEKIKEGQSVVVNVTLLNNQQRAQKYELLLQLKAASGGAPVALLSKKGNLNNGMSEEINLILEPLPAGDYTATLFVWQSISSPTALSPQLTFDIRISSR